ncbi:MAG: hypothetical protein ACOC7K_01840, partial [bacterium]
MTTIESSEMKLGVCNSFIKRNLVFIGFLAIVCVSGSADGDDVDTDTLRRAWMANLDLLEAVSFKVRVTANLDEDKEALRQTVELPDGGTLTLGTPDGCEYTISGSLRGGELRCRTRAAKNKTYRELQYHFKDSIWCSYDTGRSIGGIRRSSQMPSLRFLNPMNLATPDIKWSYVDLLAAQSDTPVARSQDGERYIVELDAPSGQPLVVECGVRFGMLPVRSKLLDAASSNPVVDTIIEYQRLQARDAWFPDRALSRSIDQSSNIVRGEKKQTLDLELEYLVTELSLLQHSRLTKSSN